MWEAYEKGELENHFILKQPLKDLIYPELHFIDGEIEA